MRNRFGLLTALSSAFVSEPGPGRQDPAKARDYIESSRKKAAGVRLDLMEKACSRFPLRYKGDLDFYRPHWLERYREWSITADGESDVFEPDDYWKSHRISVVEAMKDAINASAFAFDLPARDGHEAVHVPDEIARLARAACLEPVAVFARGDYIEFREQKARLDLLKEMPDFEVKYTYEQDRELFILDRLKSDERYRSSLREYFGGSVPESQKACQGRDYRLSCIAPAEALGVMRKIIYTAPASELPFLYVQLGALHLLLGGREHAALAADYYAGGVLDSASQRPARLGLVRAFLASGSTERAIEQLSQASLLYRDRGRTDGEFRALARTVLVKAGKMREADCYADLSELPTGERDYCRNFDL